MAVFGFGCTYGRTKVALCLPGLMYQPKYWFSRYNVSITPGDFNPSDHQVPPASVPLAEPSKIDDPHLLGLWPCASMLPVWWSGGG